MEIYSKTIEVNMTPSLKEMVTLRCQNLGVNYSEYLRMLIVLDINSYKLKAVQTKANNLLDSIEEIKLKLEKN